MTYSASADARGLTVTVSGRDLDALLTALAFALCDVLVPAATVRTSGAGAVVVPLEIYAADRKDLVAQLARQLLAHRARGALLPVLWASELRDDFLHGEALGERFDPVRHSRAGAGDRLTQTELREADGGLEAVLLLSS